MIRIESLAKSFGGRILFSNVDWQPPERGVIGLVGPNGVGKSTLLKILVEQEHADDGKVHRPKSLDIGYLPQEVTVDSKDPLLDFILQGAERLIAMGEELAALESAMQEPGEDIEALNDRYATLQDQFQRAGGYALESRAREIAAGMGFKHADFDSPLSSFSGGWRMRALLSRLLLRQPALLLLDEPTNHLDLESIEWLENFLRGYEGAVLVISHDRAFMNGLVDRIIELRPNGLREYKGNYESFIEQREAELLRLESQAEQQAKEIAKIESFIERFRYKATKAKQVQSRVKHLEKLERVSIDAAPTTSLEFRFPQPGRLPKIVIDLRGVAKAYGDKVIYSSLDFQICRGDKLALVGPNGAGKSTLLKLLARKITADAGEIALAQGVEIAYFAQHSVEQLDLSNTLLEEMKQAATSETSGKERDILGAFGFSGNETVNKQISVLSGGEKTRLALAKLMLKPCGVLLLDEPTNHLDIASRQVLEFALRDYDGAVCIVSHDRHFLNEVVDRIVHIDAGVVEAFDGDYDYYHWKMSERLEAARVQEQQSALTGAAGDPAKSRKDLRRALAELRKRRTAACGHLEKEAARLEALVGELEVEHQRVEALLGDPETFKDSELLAKASKDYSSLETQLEEAMEAWEAAQLELEEAREVFDEEEAALRGDG